MFYKYFNPNPRGIRVGDCSVRALSYVLKQDWKTTYLQLTKLGLEMGDMPSSNSVWGKLLWTSVEVSLFYVIKGGILWTRRNKIK